MTDTTAPQPAPQPRRVGYAQRITDKQVADYIKAGAAGAERTLLQMAISEGLAKIESQGVDLQRGKIVIELDRELFLPPELGEGAARVVLVEGEVAV